MEWPALDHHLPKSYFDFFKYGEGESQLYRSHGLRRWRLETETSWESWFEKDLFKQDQMGPGLWVLVCPRLPENSTWRRPVHHLPFTRNTYEMLSAKFYLHQSSKRAISRGISYFSRLVLQENDAGGTTRIVYNATMAKSLGEDIAMTATHIIPTGLTYAVIYGCSEKQKLKILERLQNAGESAHHPLLAVGIFAEIQRERLLNRVEELLDQSVERTEALRNESRGLIQVFNAPGERPADLLDLYDESRSLMKYLKEAKRQLSKIVDHLDELPAIQDGRRPADDASAILRKQETERTGRRMRERLWEIMEEYDAKIDDCQTVMQDLTVTTQFVMGHIARREAEISISLARSTKRDNAQMKSIATLTMVCLPLTAVASIFSMGVFNWNPEAGQGVLTIYFWVYVGVAGSLTAVTLSAWLWLTAVKRHDDEKDLKALMSV